MKTEKNWNDIKWIIEFDGTLCDIYVQDVAVSDWGRVIDLINSDVKVLFGIGNEDLTYSL